MRSSVASAAGRLGLVGRDLARPGVPASRRDRWIPVALACVLIAALAVVTLRIDLIRVRYGLGDALTDEKALLEQRREVLASVRTLRDPARLARLARERGLGRPAVLIDLPPRALRTARP